MPDPDHGTIARYKRGCHCDACRAASAEEARHFARMQRDQRRSDGELETSWPRDLFFEATAHDVRSLDHRRRLAMALRRTAEIANESGADALGNLMRLAADELDNAKDPTRPGGRGFSGHDHRS
jgi:hypothetical protein